MFTLAASPSHVLVVEKVGEGKLASRNPNAKELLAGGGLMGRGLATSN